MKSYHTVFALLFGILLGTGMLISGCKTDEPTANPGTKPPTVVDTLTVADLDKLSDHLQLLGATKKTGKSPASPAGSSLKISIKDTLYVVEGMGLPIKFLHRDTTRNVSGAYVQVHSMVGGGTLATYFYDVPEIPEVAQSDTVSAIGFGFNIAGFINAGGVLPAGAPSHIFDVTITPYDETGQPLDETVIPVVIDNTGDSKSLGSGSCPLVLPEGEHWEWFATITIKSGVTAKYGAPEVITGGQYINGCCENGFSSYSTNCAPEYTRLYFNTYYQAAYESIIFKADGTYSRVTREEYANPAPNKSNFCGSGEGEIEEKTFIQHTEGKWTVEKNVSMPQTLKDFYKEDARDYLRLTLTSSKPSGGLIKTRGGFVHQNPCPPALSRASKGTLAVSIPDNEGSDLLVLKFFERSKLAGKEEDEWFAFL
jgi:hypothetical protein